MSIVNYNPLKKTLIITEGYLDQNKYSTISDIILNSETIKLEQVGDRNNISTNTIDIVTINNRLDGYKMILETNEIESLNSYLTIGGNLTTSTLNLGTSIGMQTINIGNGIGSGLTEINIGGYGDIVNIQGTTITTNTINVLVTNKNIILNDGGSTGSSGDVGILIQENGINTNSFMKTNSMRTGFEFKSINSPLISLNQSLLTTDTPIFTNIKSNSPIETNHTVTKEYNDNLCAIYASSPQCQYIGGSSNFNIDESSNLFGGLSDLSDHGISFGKSGKLQIISMTQPIYIIRNGDYIMTTDLAFTANDKISVTGFGASTWNTIVTSNMDMPIITLPSYIILHPSDSLTEITLISDNNYVVIWISSTSKYFTNPITYTSNAMTLLGSEIGPINKSLYIRASIQINNTNVYSNTYLISVASLDPFHLGQAGLFCLFTQAGSITNVGISTFADQVGTDYGIITNITGTNVHDQDYETQYAASILLNIYNQIVASPYANMHSPAFSDGEVLYPGVYEIAGAASMPAGILTLDANGSFDAIFIIKISGAFALAAGSNIQLINGASTFSVYFVIAGAIACGANSNLAGTYIVLAGAIAIGADSIISGRMYTIAGAITSTTCAFTNITLM